MNNTYKITISGLTLELTKEQLDDVESQINEIRASKSYAEREIEEELEKELKVINKVAEHNYSPSSGSYSRGGYPIDCSSGGAFFSHTTQCVSVHPFISTIGDNRIVYSDGRSFNEYESRPDGSFAVVNKSKPEGIRSRLVDQFKNKRRAAIKKEW